MVFTLATLVAAGESLIVLRVLPEHLAPEDLSQPVIAAAIFAFNYGILLLYMLVVYPNFIDPLRKFPGPKYSWLDLNFLTFLWKRRKPFSLFLRIAQTYPNDDIIALPSGFGATRLLLTGPASLQDVLAIHPYDFVKPTSIRNFLRRILGNGLIIVEGEQHRFLRKNSLAAFGYRQIRDLYPMMWKKAVCFADALEGSVREQCPDIADRGEGKADIMSLANKVTLDVIGIAGLGRDFNTLTNSDDQLAQDYESILEPSFEKGLYFLLSARLSNRVVEWLPWRLNRQFNARMASVRRLCGQFVREKREVLTRVGGGGNFDVLSLLMKIECFSDEVLGDQLLTYLAAGHETTSAAFTWAIYLLAKYPCYQTALFTELTSALSPSNPPATSALAATLERLPYLNGILHETLRLYPTVPLTFRVAAQPTQILGHAVPAGTEIVISPWLVNRHPERWGPDAAEFRPERWIDHGRTNNTGGAGSNYDLLTFLHGPRSCIGQGFAKAELRCLVAALVLRFEWTLNMREEDVIMGGAVTIKPARGMHLRMKLREVRRGVRVSETTS